MLGSPRCLEPPTSPVPSKTASVSKRTDAALKTEIDLSSVHSIAFFN